MKKISVFALLAGIALPAFATETTVATDAVAETPAIVEATATETAAESATDVAKITETAAESSSNEEVDVSTDEVSDVKNKKTSFPHGLQIGVGASVTSGVNGFIGYANKNFDSFWAKRFGVRFDFGTMSPVKTKLNETINDIIDDEIEIGDNLAISNFEMDGHHYAALLDFYPFGNTWLLGGWRLTGGYYFGNLNVTAHVAGEIDELDNTSYEFELMDTHFKYVGNSVHGTAELDWDYRGPYLGTGFDFGLFAGFKIYLDAGVVFTNKSAQLNLDVPFDNLQMMENGSWETVQGTPLEDTVNNIINETVADAQSELDDLKFYPMVKLGFMYRF